MLQQALQQLLPPALLDDIQRVEAIVMERVQSRAPIVKIAGPQLLAASDGRLRAALTLLAAQLGSYDLQRVQHAASAVELINAAAFVHHELVDEAERRRGIVDMDARWDHGVALMIGDYFFALSAGEMALAPDPRVISYCSQAVMNICEGGLITVMQAAPQAPALEQYYEKIGCKTAALFAAGCKAGIALGGGSEAEIERLGQFGYDLGLAFQIVDDILDYTGEPADTAQAEAATPAHVPAISGDMQRGVITLPLIYAVAQGGGAELAAVVDTQDTAQLTWATSEVRRLGIAPARADAQRLVEQALAHLAAFPASAARQQLEAISRFVLQRAG
jgi:heptaprenyl diphosphate synthase/octaprenyl-diphosphate synthase